MSPCFVAGTLITLEDGLEIPIEDVRVGMRIRQVDPTTLAQTVAVVEACKCSSSNEMASVITESGRTISVTTNHPFFLPDDRLWASVSGAADGEMMLKAGDKLLTADADGDCYDVIKAITLLERAATVVVYNLTTDGHHCYLLVASWCTMIACSLVTSRAWWLERLQA